MTLKTHSFLGTLLLMPLQGMVHLFFCVQKDFHSTICNSSLSINSRKLTIFKCHWGKLKAFEMTSYYLSAKKPELTFECKSLFQLLIQISTITSLIFKYSPHKSIPHQWVRHAPWLNEYPVWIKTHAELPKFPSKCQTVTQIRRHCTIPYWL